MTALTVGESIRRIRRRLGLNTTDFALMVGSTSASISRYENGKLVPSRSMAMLLLTQAKTAEERAPLELLVRTEKGANSGEPPTPHSGDLQYPKNSAQPTDAGTVASVLSLLLAHWNAADFRECVLAVARIWDIGDPEIKDSLTRNCRTFKRMSENLEHLGKILKRLGVEELGETGEFERRIDEILAEAADFERENLHDTAASGAVETRGNRDPQVGGRPVPPPRNKK